MSLKLKVWNIGTEGMEYVSIFNLKMPHGIHVCARKMCHVPFMTAVLYVLYLLLFLMCLT